MKTCDKCKGNKSYKGMGGIKETCTECKGVGAVVDPNDPDLLRVAKEAKEKKAKS